MGVTLTNELYKLRALIKNYPFVAGSYRAQKWPENKTQGSRAV